MKGDLLGCRRAPENFIAMWKAAKALDSHMMLFSLFEKARTIRTFLGKFSPQPNGVPVISGMLAMLKWHLEEGPLER